MKMLFMKYNIFNVGVLQLCSGKLMMHTAGEGAL